MLDTVSSNTSLQAGVGGQFDANAVFGGKGTSRLPGSDSIADLTETAREVTVEEPLFGPVDCTSGAQGDGVCGPAKGDGLPYRTNRVVNSILRFVGR